MSANRTIITANVGIRLYGLTMATSATAPAPAPVGVPARPISAAPAAVFVAEAPAVYVQPAAVWGGYRPHAFHGQVGYWR